MKKLNAKNRNAMAKKGQIAAKYIEFSKWFFKKPQFGFENGMK